MFNEWTGIGRLVEDPEMRYTPAQVPVTDLRIAVDRKFKDSTGKRGTDFVRAVAWRKAAEVLGQHGQKGRLIMLQGSLEKRTYEAADGQRRTVVELQVRDFEFLDSKREGPSPASSLPDVESSIPDDGILQDEDVPF